MLSTFGDTRDLYKEYISEMGLLEMNTYDETNPLFTTIPPKVSRRIDYMFAVDAFYFPPINSKLKFLPLTAKQFKIETQPPGKELSDHWPLVADLTYS
jgi:hypothetical protein